MTKELLTMSEKQWQWLVVNLATSLGYLAYHTFDSRRSNPGFPDLVLVGNGKVIYAELKTEKGRVRPEQKKWLKALKSNGAEAYLWRPQDYDAVREYLIKSRKAHPTGGTNQADKG